MSTDGSDDSGGNRHKYSVPDDHWDKDDETTTADSDPSTAGSETAGEDSHEVPLTTSVEGHQLTIHHQPGSDKGGRFRVRIAHSEHSWSPLASDVEQLEWKRNYWGGGKRLNWQDLPEAVQKAIVAKVPEADEPRDLDPGQGVNANNR